MSASYLKNISVTPEPKHSLPDSCSTFLTSLTPSVSPELLDVCSSLGIKLSDLEPKSLADLETSASRLANQTRLKHFEELRKAKLAVVQRELSRRKCSAVGNLSPRRSSPGSRRLRGPDLPPVLPISAVGQLNHRLDYVSSRIDTTRRVNENQAKLLLQQHSTHQDLLRTLSEKQRKSEEQKRGREKEAKEKAEALGKHREEILRKIRALQDRREREEITKETTGKTPQPQPVSLSPLPQDSSNESLVSSSLRPSESIELDDCSQQQLAKINERLERSSKLAESRKNATRQMLRRKLEMVEVIKEIKVKKDAEEETNRIKEIERLKSSTERHLKNREVRINETIQRLEEERKRKAEKTRRELVRRDKQNRSLEKAYNQREMERMLQVERNSQLRQQNYIEKALKSDQRHELAEEYRELIHDLQINERERMMMKWRRAEQSLSEIREVRERVRSFHEKATVQLKEEKERRLRSISRGRRGPALVSTSGQLPVS